MCVTSTTSLTFGKHACNIQQMSNLLALKKAAIEAVKAADWSQALMINQQIIELAPRDLEALNRLGLAQLKLGHSKKATDTFKQVLSLDSANIIANKHLQKLKNKEATTDIVFDVNNDFIEEPGKSKIISLHRLTGRDQLQKLKVGQVCQLQIKKRFISVVDNQGKNIGALPDDISFRLCRLIQTGNEYRTIIYKVSEKQCCVQIKELSRSKKNAQIVSFPSKDQAALLMPDEFVLEEDVPFEVIDEYSEEENQELDLSKIDKNG